MALSARHSEILALLSTHPDGLSAEELSTCSIPGDGSSITLRAEMVRLRKVLAAAQPCGSAGVPARTSWPWTSCRTAARC